MLEHALGVSDRIPHFVIEYRFVDASRRLTGTMVSSNVPELCVPYARIALRTKTAKRKQSEDSRTTNAAGRVPGGAKETESAGLRL